jgi:hypothetical protein
LRKNEDDVSIAAAHYRGQNEMVHAVGNLPMKSAVLRAGTCETMRIEHTPEMLTSNRLEFPFFHFTDEPTDGLD